MFAWSSLSRTSHFSSRGHDELADEVVVLLAPLVERRLGRRHEREERVLVDDPVVERRRLEEEDEVLVLGEVVELSAVLGGAVEHLGREDVRALVAEHLPQRLRQQLVRANVVDRPHDAVLVVAKQRRRREVQRDVRRERPVEQTRRQTVVLREREPVPRRVVRHVALPRVLAEAADQGRLERPWVGAEPLEARLETLGRKGAPAIREVGAVPPEALLPRVLEQPLVELRPALDADLAHEPSFSRVLGC